MEKELTVKDNVAALRNTLRALRDSGAIHVSTHQQQVTDSLELVDKIALQVGLDKEPATAKPTPTPTPVASKK